MNNRLDVNRERNDAEQTVLKFYNWYLKDIYGKKSVESPDVKLTGDSIWQLDRSVHIKFINESHYFSSKFYDNELDVFNKCDEALKKISKEVPSGDLPMDYVKGNECDFVSYMWWTGGQGENLTSVEIHSSKITGDFATVIAVIKDASGYKYSYPRVDLRKENTEWKIDRITISYQEPSL